MDLYKLFGTGAADADAVAALDIQVDGHIVAMTLEVWAVGADALNDGIECEISFASTNGFASNDTKASLIHAVATQSFLTSGGSVVRAFSSISGLAIEVAAGERLFLHANVVGAPTTYSAVGYLFVMPGVDGTARPSVRRR